MPGRFSLNKPQVSILKKSTVQRPASLGHSSAASRFGGSSSKLNDIMLVAQKKRLSWGKSKVLEFYKEEGGEEKKVATHKQLNDYSKEPVREFSARNRKMRNS